MTTVPPYEVKFDKRTGDIHTTWTFARGAPCVTLERGGEHINGFSFPSLAPAMSCVAEFHRRYNHPIMIIPELPDKDTRALRMSLVEEEYKELRAAERNNSLPEIADAASDLIYVVLGLLLSYGIPAEVFDEVQRSNMTKLGSDGKPIRRPDGKTMKGPHYEPPNLRKVLEERGWKG